MKKHHIAINVCYHNMASSDHVRRDIDNRLTHKKADLLQVPVDDVVAVDNAVPVNDAVAVDNATPVDNVGPAPKRRQVCKPRTTRMGSSYTALDLYTKRAACLFDGDDVLSSDAALGDFPCYCPNLRHAPTQPNASLLICSRGVQHLCINAAQVFQRPPKQQAVPDIARQLQPPVHSTQQHLIFGIAHIESHNAAPTFPCPTTVLGL